MPSPSLEAIVMKESPLSEISPRPRHFLPFLALTTRHSLFFFIQHSAALLTLPAYCQWDFIDPDGCVMNMYAIEMQLFRSLCMPVSMFSFTISSTGTKGHWLFWSHALWKDNGAIHAEQKWKLMEKGKRDSWHFKMVKIYISCKFYFDH